MEFPTWLLLLICWAVMIAGIAFHFLTKLSELEQAGVILAPGDYWRRHPYTSALVILAAHLMLVVTLAMGELSIVGSLFIGVGCNSIGDKFRARAALYTDRTLGKTDVGQESGV